MNKKRIQVPRPWLRFVSVTLLKLFYRFEIHGLAHLNSQTGGFILAGNHTGYLDSLMIYAALNRDFSFLMTEEVLSWRIIGKIVRYGNIIPLFQGKEKRVLAESLRLLKAGHPLCIFPEGKLTETGHMNPFQEGVAFLHEKSQVPVVPFAIQGGFQAWGYQRPWPSFRKKITLRIGAPMHYDPHQHRANLTRNLYRQVSALLKAPLASERLTPSLTQSKALLNKEK